MCRSASQGVRSGPAGSWPVAVPSCCTVRPSGQHARLAGALLVRASTYGTGRFLAPQRRGYRTAVSERRSRSAVYAPWCAARIAAAVSRGLPRLSTGHGRARCHKGEPGSLRRPVVPAIDANLLEVAFTCDHAVWFVAGHCQDDIKTAAPGTADATGNGCRHRPGPPGSGAPVPPPLHGRSFPTSLMNANTCSTGRLITTLCLKRAIAVNFPHPPSRHDGSVTGGVAVTAA
jgi:hypothetical protein